MCDRLSAETLAEATGEQYKTNHIKGIRTTLQMKVYQKNTRAIRFYLREGFEILSEGVDEATGEKEYVMIWQERKIKSDY